MTCELLRQRPPGSISDSTQPAVACDESGTTKYLLDVAPVLGTDVVGATAVLDTTLWRVDLTFSASGADRLLALSREAFDGECMHTVPDSNTGREVCQMAIVVDNVVMSAPTVQAVLSTNASITGTFDEKSARLLAEQLTSGSLPVVLEFGCSPPWADRPGRLSGLCP